jgi:endonuclease G
MSSKTIKLAQLVFVALCVMSTPVQAVSEWKLWAMEKAASLIVDKKTPETAFDKSSTNGPYKSIDLNYGFYRVNYNCVHRGYNYVYYDSVPDSGKLPRYEPFELEPRLSSSDCPGQKTSGSYKAPRGAELYHRGHGTHQNIWDHDVKLMRLTNRMTNVVPHHGVQNTAGLWRALEKRVECARDLTTAHVFLGNAWGNDASNDYFVKSHGVTTPDYLWRVHTYDSHPNQAYVWVMKNNGDARPRNEDAQRVTLEQLKKMTVNDFTWPIPTNWVDGKGRDPYYKARCSLE